MNPPLAHRCCKDRSSVGLAFDVSDRTEDRAECKFNCDVEHPGSGEETEGCDFVAGGMCSHTIGLPALGPLGCIRRARRAPPAGGLRLARSV